MNIKKKIIATTLISSALIACGGGGGSSSNSDASAQNNEEQSTQAPARALLNVLIPEALAADMPEGAEITVTINGQGETFVQVLAEDEIADFEDLVVGDYNVDIVITSNGTIIGQDSNSFTLTSDGLDVTADFEINTANMSVSPTISSDYSFLVGDYDGKAVRSGDCTIEGFEIPPTDAVITLTDKSITLTLDVFPDPTYVLDGTLNDDSGTLAASGTYQGSDFTNGTWSANTILIPNEGSLYINLSLANVTDSCTLNMQYLAFKE